MRLRSATPDDLDAICALEQETFGTDAWSRAALHEELTADHRAYLALVDDERVVGYGGLLAIGADGDIQTIAVAPAVRGTGQGRRLMNALLDEAAARGVRRMFLDVRADNPVAQSLYASLGFVRIDVRPRYYQPGHVDAIVMRLDLKDRR
ncbi:ribosomal protein S18-alanine N-acetyltransferase [Leucobacter weissii]|uniref:[Ribosomal protein bS18]-alanine N-acetyltransferase n=1 Tax=Leucobacter weissii TaxID=1983706 RepID=A0A939MMM2_9MICO|nr:ribosomal protein S18-alanine N-acetyltransferase [Leucobacter weissii]MBO1903035.1 ribosomal protein S18-alanine N-acetyltransferase [Leucobacter weissii]